MLEISNLLAEQHETRHYDTSPEDHAPAVLIAVIPFANMCNFILSHFVAFIHQTLQPKVKNTQYLKTGPEEELEVIKV